MDYYIIYEDDTEFAEFDTLCKGFRNDVIVVSNNRKYRLYFTNIERLYQDVKSEFDRDGMYLDIPNTVIVREITKQEIEKKIKMLYEQGLFDKLSFEETE